MECSFGTMIAICIAHTQQDPTQMGLFPMMAVMAAATGASIGIRMVYIDREYRQAIESLSDKARVGLGASGALVRRREGLRRSQDYNGIGVIVDGACAAIIIIFGVAAAFGIFPSLHFPAIVAGMLFVTSTVFFQHHARSVIKSLGDL